MAVCARILALLCSEKIFLLVLSWRVCEALSRLFFCSYDVALEHVLLPVIEVSVVHGHPLFQILLVVSLFSSYIGPVDVALVLVSSFTIR